MVLGTAGNVLPEGMPLKVAWAASGLGLMVAYVLLAARSARRSRDDVAAGFLLMALGESVLFAGLGAGIEGSQTSFAGGASIYLAGLLLISLPREFAIWARGAGVVAALLFAVAALQIYAGQSVPPNTSPLVGTAYGLLTIAAIGWILAVLPEVRGARRGPDVGRDVGSLSGT